MTLTLKAAVGMISMLILSPADAKFSLASPMFSSSGAAMRRAPGVEAPDSPSVGAPGLEARVSLSVESRDEEAIAQRYGGPQHRSTQRNGVNPAWAEPVLSCPVLSCPVLSCLVLSCLVLSCLVLSLCCVLCVCVLRTYLS